MFENSDKNTVPYVPLGYWFICVGEQRTRMRSQKNHALWRRRYFFETEKDTEKKRLFWIDSNFEWKERNHQRWNSAGCWKIWISKRFFEIKKTIFRRIYSNSIINLEAKKSGGNKRKNIFLRLLLDLLLFVFQINIYAWE